MGRRGDFSATSIDDCIVNFFQLGKVTQSHLSSNKSLIASFIFHFAQSERTSSIYCTKYSGSRVFFPFPAIEVSTVEMTNVASSR